MGLGCCVLGVSTDCCFERSTTATQCTTQRAKLFPSHSCNQAQNLWFTNLLWPRKKTLVKNDEQKS